MAFLWSRMKKRHGHLGGIVNGYAMLLKASTPLAMSRMSTEADGVGNPD